MRSSEHMRIGILARESGLPVRTLRFYEAQGLIMPLGRTAKGYRLYGPAALKEVAFLQGAKRLGLRLDQIRELLQIRSQGQCPCSRTRELMKARLEEVDAALREIRDLRDQMRQTVRAWESEPKKAAPSACRSMSSGIPAGG